LKELSPDKLQKLKESFETIIDFLNIEEIDASPIITADPNISKRNDG
jgi:Asp-tRNA(Asn)/Glu-tRNA(Gln) amidotransferase C subunit